MFVLTDPHIAEMSIQEDHEPFVDVRNEGRIAIGPSPEVPDNRDYTFLCKTVDDKLLQA